MLNSNNGKDFFGLVETLGGWYIVKHNFQGITWGPFKTRKEAIEYFKTGKRKKAWKTFYGG